MRSVPAEILSKPGRITDIEMNLIRIHPESGYEILRDAELPYPIAEIVLQHHERLDGSGYPHGLKGTQILLEAQIIGVADVVEAIASHRPRHVSGSSGKRSSTLTDQGFPAGIRSLRLPVMTFARCAHP